MRDLAYRGLIESLYDGIIGLESFAPSTWTTRIVPTELPCFDTSAVSPDGSWIATNAGGTRVIVVARDSGRVVHRFVDTDQWDGNGNDMAFSPDSRTVVMTISEHYPPTSPKLRMIDVLAGTQRLAGHGLQACEGLSFHPEAA